MNELPIGWIETTLDQIAQWGSGGTPSRRDPANFGGTIPWIKTGELGQRFVDTTEEKISERGLNSSSAKLFPPGSVAIAMYGATIGKTSILGIEAATNQACAVAIPDVNITTTGYLYHYLCSQRDAFVDAGKGGAQPNISQSVLKTWPVPLPPLPEQKRIADKLDRLLARVDACRERLDRVPALLKRFRQSVLAAATSGELTREWREERGLHHANQSISLDEDTVSFPASWSRASLINLLDPSRPLCYGVVQPGEATASGPFLVRVQDLSDGSIAQDDLRTIPDSVDQEYRRSRIRSGDVLISVVGTIGRVAIVPDSFEGNIARALARLACGPQVLPYWMRSWLESSAVQWWLSRNSREVARKTLNLSELATLQCAVPPLAEQDEIARRTQELFSFASRIESRLREMQGLVESTTPATLAKAFRGELVPQDPTDEPAAALLARIAAARDDAGAPARRGRRKAPTGD